MRRASHFPGAGAGEPLQMQRSSVAAPVNDAADAQSAEVASERQLDALRASVSPHELTDERRDDYIAELWTMFSKKAVRGQVGLEDATALALKFPIEGASDEAVRKAVPHDSASFTFEEIVAMFDVISRAASEEFRDIDMEQRETQEEVELPPHKYLWSKMPCSGYPPDVRYRLEEGWRLADMTPKTTLIITTSILMAVIGVALLVITYVLWTASSLNRETEAFDTVKSTIDYLTSTYERQFYAAQYVEQKDQTVIIASLADYMMRRHVQQTVARATASVRRIRTLDEPPHVPVRSPGLVAAALQLSALGVRFRQQEFADLAKAHGFVNQLGTVVAANATNATEACSLAVPPYNETEVGQLPNFIDRIVARAWEPYYIPPDPTDPSDVGFCFRAGLPPFRLTPTDTISSSYPLDANGSSSAVLLSGDGFVDKKQCVDKNDDYSCTALEEQLRAGVRESASTPAMRNATSIWAAESRTIGGGFIVVATEYSTYLEDRQNALIAAMAWINSAFARTTEIVVGREDPVTGEFVSQATPPLFKNDCFFACERIPAAQRNALVSWATQGNYGSITPDYRPQAVSGYASFMPTLQAVLLLERDMIEIRSRGLTSFVSMLEAIGQALPDAEVLAFRYLGAPSMPTFDPYEPCPPGADCITAPSTGIYFVYGCADCMRYPTPPPNATIEVLTKTEKPLPSSLTRDSVGTALAMSYRDVLFFQRSVAGTFHDYTGTLVEARGFYVHNYSIGVMVQMDAATFHKSWWWEPVVAVLISAAVLVAGLLTVCISTNLSLGSMERDWLLAKDEIEREKAHFARAVGDLVPPNLSQRMLKGQRIVAETMNNVAVVFADICAFSEFTAEMSAKHVVRLVAYAFHTLQVVADDCGLLRLSSVGDTYIVYGSTPTSEIKADPERHAAVRAAKFGVLGAMVFSPLVSHWPETIKLLKEGFKDRARDTEPFKVPRIRFGGHCGVVPSGIVQTDAAPRFDIYGLVPSLAARMCATSAPDRFHMTAFMKDAVTVHDTKRMFHFDDPRKTIVRGQGTVTSYFIRSTAHDLRNDLIESLHVRRAPLVVIFDGDKRRKRGAQGSELESSTHSDKVSKSSKKSAER